MKQLWYSSFFFCVMPHFRFVKTNCKINTLESVLVLFVRLRYMPYIVCVCKKYILKTGRDSHYAIWFMTDLFFLCFYIIFSIRVYFKIVFFFSFKLMLIVLLGVPYSLLVFVICTKLCSRLYIRAYEKHTSTPANWASIASI